MTQRSPAVSPAIAAGALAVGIGTLAAYSLGIEPYRLEVTQTELWSPRLPAALDGLSLLLLADMHTRQWGRRERRLAELLDVLPTPDIAVLAGDTVEGAAGITPVVTFIERHLRARHARYAILGNAEHKPPRATRRNIRQCFAATGMTLLVNENVPLTIGQTTITVAGTDDPYYGHADLDTTLAGRDVDRFCLLLAHSPQIVYAAARAGVDVMLSGHTHGGQVRLPLVGPLKTQNPLGRALDAGLFDRARLTSALHRDPEREIVLYVSRGIGTARFRNFPLYPRLLCRPEIAWLTLRHAAAPVGAEIAAV